MDFEHPIHNGITTPLCVASCLKLGRLFRVERMLGAGAVHFGAHSLGRLRGTSPPYCSIHCTGIVLAVRQLRFLRRRLISTDTQL
jgi:hypothetical protein